MKTKRFMMMALLAMMVKMVAAQSDAKYCMNYNDFVNNKWKSIEELVNGKSNQMVQLKFDENQYKLKTGDKQSDAVLKKEALVVEYGGRLYVNCRNLRCNDIVLDVMNYTQAYRFDNNKLLVVAHYTSTGAFLGAMAGDVISIVAPTPVAIPAMVGSTALWVSMDQLGGYRCYILDTEANAKGKTPVVRVTDEVMEKILANDAQLMARYKAISSKKNRQSASNILPILKEKKLITESI